MKSYNLSQYLDGIYNAPVTEDKRPIIGITTNYEDIDATLRSVYYRQIVNAGGTPLLIPPVADEAVIKSTLSHIDALLLTGGADFNLHCFSGLVVDDS